MGDQQRARALVGHALGSTKNSMTRVEATLLVTQSDSGSVALESRDDVVHGGVARHRSDR